MERLWAPWRMQYIGGMQKPGCLFERVVEHPDDEDAELVVWRPDGAIVMLNKFPYNPGHAMVAPIAHQASLADLDDPQTADVMRAVKRTIAVLEQVMNPDGFNVGVNIGREAAAFVSARSGCHCAWRRHVVAASMPASGSAVSTGASEPNANRTPARSSARHA